MASPRATKLSALYSACPRSMSAACHCCHTELRRRHAYAYGLGVSSISSPEIGTTSRTRCRHASLRRAADNRRCV
ncbi:hypothetical protein BDN72DRAFT_534674 [Pluteus cervinus]|uniref:Uncharacterized protein n=1 Tax=Pluteus cervinus TaxID=181527 RepID=A0ACD3A3M8_9AGAR|nr:hypothetical protein BDN72DRAFT_534674 [Pluteus cervinus]